MNTVTSQDVLDLLAIRHSTDVFVSECKGGGVTGSNMIDPGRGCEYVGLLARTLLLNRSRLWAMLAAYFDESGTHDDSNILVVAGLISPVFQWERLTTYWNRVLDEKGLPAFHTVDCAHGRGAFESWKAKDRQKLYVRLVNLTKRHVLWRTWAAVVVPDYLQFFKDASRSHSYAYGFCAFACASRIKQLAIERNVLVPYIFERGGRGGKMTARMFKNLIDAGQQEHYRMGELSLDSRENLVPLQAADMHAYEVYKYFADQLEENRRPVRRSFWELMRIKEAGGGGIVFDAPKIESYLERAKDQDLDGVGITEYPFQIDKLTERSVFAWNAIQTNNALASFYFRVCADRRVLARCRGDPGRMNPTIGKTSDGKALHIDVDRLIISRALIQANSGAGKSWAIRRLLEQTHGRVQHLVLDVEGEFYTLRERYETGLEPATPTLARRCWG